MTHLPGEYDPARRIRPTGRIPAGRGSVIRTNLMKITHIERWRESLSLARPYTIAARTISHVDLFYVRIEIAHGLIGLGAASPSQRVTGETPEACEAALDEAAATLRGADARHLGALCRQLATRLRATPAARAALDMALYDLLGQQLGVPVVDVLGHRGAPLPTSITIGIMDTAQALEDARDYIGRGFCCLKVKIGLDLEADIERLHRLREAVGAAVKIRVDGNQGYGRADTLRLASATADLDLELVEQPLPATDLEGMRQLPAALRARTAADESLIDERDALTLAQPPAACGIYNIKLMKCGGITPAMGIATIAEAADITLMWGCMDESVISISAALHAAHASPATRYLDLDGSFDLTSDIAEGGFHLREGHLHLTDAPGLGVRLKV